MEIIFVIYYRNIHASLESSNVIITDYFLTDSLIRTPTHFTLQSEDLLTAF